MSIGTDNPSLPVVSPGEDNENNNNNNKGTDAKRHTKNYYRILFSLVLFIKIPIIIFFRKVLSSQ